MSNINQKSTIVTIPNILSAARILMIPLYSALYLRAQAPRQFLFAAFILTLACLTDLLDGYIARHFHMESVLGRILDPIADKATQLSVTLCLSIRYPMLRIILLLLAMKESFQTIAGLYCLQHGKMLRGALWAGKICTTVFFISLIILVLFPQMPQSVILCIVIIDSFFLMHAFVSYFLAYRAGIKQQKRSE